MGVVVGMLSWRAQSWGSVQVKASEEVGQTHGGGTGIGRADWGDSQLNGTALQLL